MKLQHPGLRRQESNKARFGVMWASIQTMISRMGIGRSDPVNCYLYNVKGIAAFGVLRGSHPRERSQAKATIIATITCMMAMMATQPLQPAAFQASPARNAPARISRALKAFLSVARELSRSGARARRRASVKAVHS
jgi:hypothetical protein